MRRLLPDQVPLEPADTYAGLTLRAPAPGAGRPWIAVGMVASADGAAAVDGRTAALGGEADRAAFLALRGACDAILVGAGTVRDEDYGPPAGGDRRRADRVARGLAPVPRLVVVSGSLSLDPQHRVFGDPDARPLLLTTAGADAARRRRLAEVADLVDCGDERLELELAAAELARRGLKRVLCEGGPRLNGSLLAAGLVDELFLTVAAVALGGPAPRIAVAQAAGPASALELISVHEHAGELLLRYHVGR